MVLKIMLTIAILLLLGLAWACCRVASDADNMDRRD